MIPPVIAVVGTSNSGKTTFLQKLIIELKKRGYQVGTVKHTHHEVEFDQPETDTWLHAQAGADSVVLASPGRLSMVKKVPGDPLLKQAVELLKDMDLILVEGYKGADVPKIEVLRKGIAEKPVSKPEDLLAVLSNMKLSVPVPVYGLDDVIIVAQLIIENYLNKKM